MHSLSKSRLRTGKPSAATLWQSSTHASLTGCGARALLDLDPVAFFASRQCPGVAIRMSMNWALQQTQTSRPVISGFHSPLEQSVLKILIAAGSPVIAVLARPVAGARLPSKWAELATKGRMAVVSNVVTASRLTGQLAIQRNVLAAQLAKTIVVAHASPGGSLAMQITAWQREGRTIDWVVQA